MKIAIVIILVLLLSCEFVSASEPEQAICAQQVQEVIGKLNILYAKQQAPLIPFDSTQLSCGEEPTTLWKTRFYRCSFPSGMVFECLPEEKQVVGYIGINPDIFTDKIPMPQLTLQQAAEAAKPWVKAVLGDLPLNLAPPRGTFHFNMRDAHRFYSGEWHIRWQRTDAHGHLFERDDLVAEYSEKFGLIACFSNFNSTFDTPLGKPISKEDALAVARPAAEDWLKNKMSASVTGSGWHLGPVQAELWVVDPNNFFHSETKAQIVNDLHARLAWKCVFPLVSEKTPSELEHLHAVVVKIDALTKEVIGGDYQPIGKNPGSQK